MFESFGKGWSFLKQAWGMVGKDKDLLKPTLYSLAVSGVVAAIGIVPIIAAAFLLGESDYGQIVLAVLAGILMFAQFIVSYVFSAMTIQLIYDYLTEGDGKMSKGWAIVRRDFWDIATLAAASTVVGMLKNAANRNRKGGAGAAIARAGANTLSFLWTEAALLILPAMVIDDLNLKKGGARVLEITKQNLMLIGVSTVGVNAVTGLIGFVITMIGLVLGLAIGGGLGYASGGDTLTTGIGIGLGLLVFFAFVILSTAIGTYTKTAYHTCLYIWARDVETAKEKGKSTEKVAAPAPLAAVLS